MDSKDESRGPELDDDQALWRLLGRERPVKVSPYFARRVLRDLDTPAGGASAVRGFGWLAWLRPGGVLAGCAAVIAAGLGVWSFASLPVTQPDSLAIRQDVTSPPAVAPGERQRASLATADDVSPQDVEIIADLDSTVAREETNVWTDETVRF